MDLNHFEQWQKQLGKTQLLHWNELPKLALYVDQMVSLVNDRLSGLGLSPLTKSMVNNYVKKGVIMAPVKKKYSTNQVAAITIITLLKGIYSLDSLQSAFAQLEINDYPQAVYNRFVDLFNALLRGDKFPEASSIAKVNERLLQLAAHDAYDHLLASQLLKEMQSVQTPAELKH